jgi:hypothetical protein
MTGRLADASMIPMIQPTEQDARFASEQLATGCESLERLLLGLLEGKDPIESQIHAIRKLGKSLRGGFCLFRLGKAPNKDIQAIGRLLSGSRDAVSRRNTWGKLGWEEDPSAAAAITGLLDQQTQSAGLPPRQEAIAWCVNRAQAAHERLRKLPTEHLAERMELGVGKLHKQVTKRARRLDPERSEDFHDLRKALKAHLGALAFLPDKAVNEQPIMVEMAELLGDENDLSTLSTWLAQHGFTADFVPGLWKILGKKRAKLRRRILRDAKSLSSPAIFTDAS